MINLWQHCQAGYNKALHDVFTSPPCFFFSKRPKQSCQCKTNYHAIKAPQQDSGKVTIGLEGSLAASHMTAHSAT